MSPVGTFRTSRHLRRRSEIPRQADIATRRPPASYALPGASPVANTSMAGWFCAFPRQTDPTGKSLLIFRNGVKPGKQKYSASPIGQITGTNLAIPSHSEGRRPSSRTLGRVAVDVEMLFDERHRSVRRSRVVPTPRRWRQVCSCASIQLDRARASDGGKKARSPRRARYKP
jgi:hypothetical protein